MPSERAMEMAREWLWESCLSNDSKTVKDLAALIDAETERCAGIAKGMAGPLGVEPLSFWGGQRDACFSIAAAIRGDTQEG